MTQLFESFNILCQMMHAKYYTNEKEKYSPEPILFHQHVHYIGNMKLQQWSVILSEIFMFQDFSRYGVRRPPIYFNIVRDPFERLVKTVKLNLPNHFIHERKTIPGLSQIITTDWI